MGYKKNLTILQDTPENNKTNKSKIEIKILSQSDNKVNSSESSVQADKMDQLSKNFFIRKIAGIKNESDNNDYRKKLSILPEKQVVSEKRKIVPHVLNDTESLGFKFPSNIDSSYFSSFGLSDFDKQDVVNIIRKINLLDTSEVLKFGSEMDKKISTLADMILEVSKGINVSMDDDLHKIQEAVTSVGEDEILGTGNVMQRFRSFLIGCSPVAQIEIALNQVDVSIGVVNSKLPKFINHIGVLDSVLSYSLNLNKELDLYIIAGKIALQYYEDKIRTNVVNKINENSEYNIHLQTMDFSRDIIDNKITSLRELRLSAESDPVQINVMKTSYKSVIDVANSVILSLVPQWKRHCGLAVTILNSNGKGVNQRIGTTTGEILVVRDEIIKGINTIDKHL